MKDFDKACATMGYHLWSFACDLKQWSQETFGSDEERGPLGPLKHLALEAQEAQDDITDKMEYADCFILIVDAARRAGISIVELVKLAEDKMQINKARTWLPPVNDEPVRHVG